MITILCSGSRGDYQPYIALAQQLKKLGKNVRVTATTSYQDFIKSYDIEVYPIEADFQTLNIDPAFLEKAASADNPLKMLLAFNKMKKFAVHLAQDYYNACLDSELLVYHPGCTMAYFAGESLGIPSALASPFPMHKTNEVLSVVMYGKTPSNLVTKKISYSMLQGMLWMASSFSLKTFWKKEFGKLPDSFGPPFERHNNATQPAVISCSNHIFKRPHDWNAYIHQYGYWFVEESADFTPPAEVSEFLSAGDKPVYIGFGSMAGILKQDGLADIVAEAILKCGKRAIISGLGRPKNINDNILAIDSLPHSWLFDKVSAVCHHGGAGTSAAGFRAGVPSIIVPFSNDQFAWAHRAYDLGIGSKPIPKKQFSSDKLCEAIQFALTDKIVNNAKSIGDKIKKENGALECAKVLASLTNS